jgi:hypothetical protein
LNATNSEFGDEGVRSTNPAIGGVGLALAAAPACVEASAGRSPPREAKLKRILMLSGESIFSFFQKLLK